MHASCHNPTGADLTLAQWQTLTALLQERRLVPFLDLAYQGFGEGLDADAAGLRMVTETLPESLIAVSNSKNLGLYRERVGALIVIAESAQRADAVQSHVLQIARGIYSMPPDHGAAIAACIFADAVLRRHMDAELTQPCAGACTRCARCWPASLREATGDRSFDFIESQHGMFSLLGISRSAVEALRETHHIYMIDDSRMNLAGIMPHNAAYVARVDRCRTICSDGPRRTCPSVIGARRRRGC